MTDRLAHLAERVHIRPLRKRALKKAEEWMLARFERSDGLGAIYPAMLNAIVALRYLGYSADDPQVIRAMDEFERLGIDCPEGTPDYPTPTFRMQPCFSPIWDTAQVLSTLGEAGVSKSDPRMVRAAEWLLAKEVRHKGDWAEKVRNVEPGGWYFEFNNEFYPDVDDTGEVLLALKCVQTPGERRQHEVEQRAIAWVFAMQCRNGGWAAFDKDNTKTIFQYIPFADHNAMLDPPTVDITGRILEMLAAYGYTRRDPRVESAIQFVLREQEPDGSWFGRWGANYLYGTFLVLRGLEAMGYWNHEPAVQNGAEWIRMVQNADGGWGETCGSYDDPLTRGIGPSTPSQTAWAGTWPAGGGRYALGFGGQGGSLAGRQADAGRHMGRIGRGPQWRGNLHGHGLSARVLSGVSPVSRLLPAACADDVPACDGTGIDRGVAASKEFAGSLLMEFWEEKRHGSSNLAGLDGGDVCARTEAEGA